MIKRMLALLVVGVAVVLAAGCSSDRAKGPTYPIVGTVDQVKMEQSAFAARSAYAAILHLMAEYVALPRCVSGGPKVCSSQAMVNDMRRYELAADIATKGAADIARSPTKTSLSLANAVSDAERAVAAFRASVAAINPKAQEAS